MTMFGVRWRLAVALFCSFAITIIYAFLLPGLWDIEVVALMMPMVLLGACCAMTDYLPVRERWRLAVALVCSAMVPGVAWGKWAVARLLYTGDIDDVLMRVRLLVDLAELYLGVSLVVCARAIKLLPPRTEYVPGQLR